MLNRLSIDERTDVISLLTLLLVGFLSMGFIASFHNIYPLLSDIAAYTFTIYLILLAATKLQQFISWFREYKK